MLTSDLLPPNSLGLEEINLKFKDALEKNDISTVTCLLETAYENITIKNKRKAFKYVARHGREALMDILIQKCETMPDENTTQEVALDEGTVGLAFNYAAENKHIHILSLILEKTKNLTSHFKKIAFFESIQDKNHDVFKFLDSKLNLEDKASALVYAAEMNNKEIFDILYEKNLEVTSEDAFKIFCKAATNGWEDIAIFYLRKMNAKEMSITERREALSCISHKNILKHLLDQCPDISEDDKFFALENAVLSRENVKEKIKILFDNFKSCDLNIPLKSKILCFYNALCFNAEFCDEEIISLILNTINREEKLLFLRLDNAHCHATLRKLLDCSTDITKKDIDEAFSEAISNKNIKLIYVFIKNIPDLTPEQKKAALFIATENRRADIVAMLLKDSAVGKSLEESELKELIGKVKTLEMILCFFSNLENNTLRYWSEEKPKILAHLSGAFDKALREKNIKLVYFFVKNFTRLSILEKKKALFFSLDKNQDSRNGDVFLRLQCSLVSALIEDREVKKNLTINEVGYIILKITENKFYDLLEKLEYNELPLSLVFAHQLENETLTDENIRSFVQRPSVYIDHHPYLSLAQRQAALILTSEAIMKRTTALSRTPDNQANADDVDSIKLIVTHFEAHVKPRFKDCFNRFGDNLLTQINKIEEEIRNKLLSHMENEIEEKLKTDSMQTSYFQLLSFISENRNILKKGENEETLDLFRKKIQTARLTATHAWCGYDQYAPCDSEWPNLLTPPTDDRVIFSLKATNAGELRLRSASLLLREMVCYSYLLVVDDEGSREDKESRLINFITQLNDMRRAHNRSTIEAIDSPSCYPGGVRRAGNMWMNHSLKLSGNRLSTIKSILTKIIFNSFSSALRQLSTDGKGLTVEQKNNILCSLTFLSRANAQKVFLKKDINYDETLAQIRRQFYDHHFLSYKKIIEEINKELTETKQSTILNAEYSYIYHHLLDLGGSWIASKLCQHPDLQVIEKDSSVEEEETVSIELKNPYSSKSQKHQKFESLKTISSDLNCDIELKQNFLESIVEHAIEFTEMEELKKKIHGLIFQYTQNPTEFVEKCIANLIKPKPPLTIAEESKQEDNSTVPQKKRRKLN